MAFFALIMLWSLYMCLLMYFSFLHAYFDFFLVSAYFNLFLFFSTFSVFFNLFGLFFMLNSWLFYFFPACIFRFVLFIKKDFMFIPFCFRSCAEPLFTVVHATEEEKVEPYFEHAFVYTEPTRTAHYPDVRRSLSLDSQGNIGSKSSAQLSQDKV